MNKALYIVGIIFAFFFFFIIGFRFADAAMAYDEMLLELISGSSSGTDWGRIREEISINASIWGLVLFLTFIVIDLIGVLKVKTKTTKVMGIIGLCLSVILLGLNFMMMSDPGRVSIDEIGLLYLLYCMVMLPFSIVGLVQSNRYSKLQNGGVNTPEQSGAVDS